MAAGAAIASAADALEAATDSLRAAGCDTPELDAAWLIADALGVDRAALIADPDRALDGPQSRLVMERVRRRAAREPVAYILSRRWFREIELVVDGRVLIPRPETELLVDVALELPPGARVHDVGTGSGAVALALKHERPDLEVSASDASEAAVEAARANAARLALDVTVGVVSGLPAGNYDLVVANLPYVREDEWAGLAPEITRYEPRTALVSGSRDGLDAIRALVSEAPTGTSLALEHSPAQAAAVRGLLEDAETHSDLAGRERVTTGRAR